MPADSADVCGEHALSVDPTTLGTALLPLPRRTTPPNGFLLLLPTIWGRCRDRALRSVAIIM
jgi:hypothetical protein